MATVNDCKVPLGRFYDRAAYSYQRDCIGADWCRQQIRDMSFVGTASRVPDNSEPFWRRFWRALMHRRG